MDIVSILKTQVAIAFNAIYEMQFNEADITINTTKPEFEGDYTIVLFPFVKTLKLSPENIGKAIGEKLLAAHPLLFSQYEIVKGFLNITISEAYWKNLLQTEYANSQFGFKPKTGRKVMVEYSSPNTNKPLHLGHLRNNFLGWSISEILKANGHEVFKTCVVNDRGIHICKSMIAWERYAEGATPESTATKGDHFVGDYYIKFSTAHKEETKALINTGLPQAEAEKQAPLMLATQQMLLAWETGDPHVLSLWKEMNSWVYAGFDITYKRIGSDFQKTYYESETYLLGKELIDEGLNTGIFYKKEDGSVWINLLANGLDEKLVLRKDGTSVYITQDIGLANKKHDDFAYDESIYVIADEQNYHMKVLKLILQHLNKPYAGGINHLSYGMVELPTGRMKSREGTVVDADDLLDEMLLQAKEKTQEFGKVSEQGFSPEELQKLYETIGLGGLKFFLLKIDPKKKMIFNPEESIDLHGFTAAFIQYAYARIKSILKDAEISNEPPAVNSTALLPKEKELIVLLSQYPQIINQAGAEYNPSVIAIYAFNVAQLFNSFYATHKVLKAETEEKKLLRLQIIRFTSHVISSAMSLLGIRVPEQM